MTNTDGRFVLSFAVINHILNALRVFPKHTFINTHHNKVQMKTYGGTAFAPWELEAWLCHCFLLNLKTHTQLVQRTSARDLNGLQCLYISVCVQIRALTDKRLPRPAA